MDDDNATDDHTNDDAEPDVNNAGQDEEDTGNDEEDGCENAIEQY